MERKNLDAKCFALRLPDTKDTHEMNAACVETIASNPGDLRPKSVFRSEKKFGEKVDLPSSYCSLLKKKFQQNTMSTESFAQFSVKMQHTFKKKHLEDPTRR